MTTAQKFIQMLMADGMFESQAEQVMEQAKPQLDSVIKGYSFTWDSLADEYPEVIYTVLYSSIKPIALAWIEENAPQAWFKPMFM
jgi:hypothetical protein